MKNKKELAEKADPNCDECHGLGYCFYVYDPGEFLPNGLSYWGTCSKCFGTIEAIDPPKHDKTNGQLKLFK